MGITSAHPDDPHYVHRGGWLRATTLGGNDGIISVSSLIIGVASAGADQAVVVLSGIAGLTAGAMSMAAGEYISVSSQRDLEKADINRERQALSDAPDEELNELETIYRERGLSDNTAATVARELMAHDALGAHLRDEVGIIEAQRARPLQAAIASGVTFSVAAFLPVLASVVAPSSAIVTSIVATALLSLAILGAAGAKAGAAPVGRAIIRVVGWGALAMAVTALIGSLFDVKV
ncbi:VIT1/CCC1 transporter family protein [Erythrobacter sp.]|jgi:VIT1/CCC1 family predicted Fe2+/Mn2+ transporter|uniref:VIT1/CCC1 transporter family protein n=1 Tax=Erythrobacter sp. TaxID=1042 RepID=UPI002EAF9FEF|nr:VIT family protein [Erythrobacter sp.]